MDKQELKNRWVSLLRDKAKYEHEARKNGEIVSSPSIDDICNEIEYFFVGISVAENRIHEIIQKIHNLNTDDDERLYLTKSEIISLIN